MLLFSFTDTRFSPGRKSCLECTRAKRRCETDETEKSGESERKKGKRKAESENGEGSRKARRIGLAEEEAEWRERIEEAIGRMDRKMNALVQMMRDLAEMVKAMQEDEDDAEGDAE